jgi:hypothetical protein
MTRRPRAPAVLLQTVGTAIVLAILQGCASVPPASPPGQAGVSAPRGAPAAPPGVATVPGRATAAPDTVPSREAQAVLATIPEPLKPEERVPPPAAAPGPGSLLEPVAARAESTALAEAETDTARAGIPVPGPVPVLGDRPLPQVVTAADTSAPASPPPAGLLPPPSAQERPRAGPPGSARASRDTCWRVQFAAPTERAKAQRYLDAGESQLLVPMVIEKEKGLFKVRTRDCLDRLAADALKRRALEAGFTGVFRVRGREP